MLLSIQLFYPPLIEKYEWKALTDGTQTQNSNNKNSAV